MLLKHVVVAKRVVAERVVAERVVAERVVAEHVVAKRMVAERVVLIWFHCLPKIVSVSRNLSDQKTVPSPIRPRFWNYIAVKA